MNLGVTGDHRVWFIINNNNKGGKWNVPSERFTHSFFKVNLFTAEMSLLSSWKYNLVSEPQLTYPRDGYANDVCKFNFTIYMNKFVSLTLNISYFILSITLRLWRINTFLRYVKIWLKFLMKTLRENTIHFSGPFTADVLTLLNKSQMLRLGWKSSYFITKPNNFVLNDSPFSLHTQYIYVRSFGSLSIT